jgi:hypothetical protein
MLISKLGPRRAWFGNVVCCWELVQGAGQHGHIDTKTPASGPVYASSYDLSVRDGHVITDVVTSVLVFVSVSVFLAHAFDAYRAG